MILKKQYALLGLLVIFVGSSANRILAAETVLKPGSIVFPNVSLSAATGNYFPLDQKVNVGVQIATKESFSSYGIRLAAAVIDARGGLPAYRDVSKNDYMLQPGHPVTAGLSFSLPKALPSGSYSVFLSALTPSGDVLATIRTSVLIDIHQSVNSLSLTPGLLKIESGGTENDLVRTTSVDQGSEATLRMKLPATSLPNAVVLPEIELFHSLRPDMIKPFQTIYGQKTILGRSAVSVSIPLPTDTEGLVYGRVHLDDNATDRTSVSNAIDFSYQVGKSFSVLEGLAIQTVNQYGPFTYVKGEAVINLYDQAGDKLVHVVFTLKDKQGSVIKTATALIVNQSGVIGVPFSFSALGALNANSYTVDARLDSDTTISGLLPSDSGILSFILSMLLICTTVGLGLFFFRRNRHKRLSIFILAALMIGSSLLLPAPKAQAADDYGQTNTLLTPSDGTNLGTFSACGAPDGTNYSGNSGCKITISGALSFDAKYLQNANGSYTDLTYHYDYLEYQVYVNGVLTADPYDPDSQRIALSSTGSSNGNDLFSFTLTPHFTGSYQIKLIPHYYYYFNSCHGAFSESCSHEWWLNDQATYTATVVANTPMLTLPTTIQNPSGASTVSLNYLSRGLSEFTLADNTGAPSYPIQLVIGPPGNFSLVTGIASIPVSHTPTQNLNASGQSTSEAVNASSNFQFADPIPVRQGDYYEWDWGFYAHPNITSLRESQYVHLIHQPTLYPGDQADYDRAYEKKAYLLGGASRLVGRFVSTGVIIPVKRYGQVAGIEPAALDLSCSYPQLPVYGVGGSRGGIIGYKAGSTTCSGTTPILNTGDTYAPEASTYQSPGTGSCGATAETAAPSICSYTRHAEVMRNYAGKIRYLFPVDTLTSRVTGNTTIISGLINSLPPTATLTGPIASVSTGDPINLSLALTNFTNSKSSGITVLPAPAKISLECASLGSTGGPCIDVQNPSVDSTFTYQAWACDGLGGQGSCITSNIVTVIVTGTGPCSAVCGGGSNSSFAYTLSTNLANVTSGSSYLLTATPNFGTLTATAVSFQCYLSDTMHSSTGTDLYGNPTYSCLAPFNATASSMQLTAMADASLGGQLDSKPRVTVIDDPAGQITPTIVRSISTYFCAGD